MSRAASSPAAPPIVGEDQALGEQLADEAPPPRAERRPDRHLLLPGAAPGPGGGWPRWRRPRGAPGSRRRRGGPAPAPPSPPARRGAGPPPCDVPCMASGKRSRIARGEGVQPALAVAAASQPSRSRAMVLTQIEAPAQLEVVARLDREHDAGPGAGGEGEAGGQHAHDGVRAVVEHQRPSEHARVGAHPRSPERVGEHHCPRAAVTSSPGRNVRPSWGRTPSTSKKLAETWSAGSWERSDPSFQVTGEVL